MGVAVASASAIFVDSALIPDILDEAEGDVIAGGEAPLSDALSNELEVASHRMLIDELFTRLVDSALDVLTSNLEESIVFE
ncbi:MAG: hypothetical protein AAFP03_12765 [Cyanobacteria bacterium J06598_3]